MITADNNFEYKSRAIGVSRLFHFKEIDMKVFCGFIVIVAVFGASQGRNAPKFTERKSMRTPFYRRQRLLEPLIVGGNPALIENFPHHLGLLDLSVGGFVD